MRNNFSIKMLFAGYLALALLFSSQVDAQLKAVSNLTGQIQMIHPEYRAADHLSIRFTITNNSATALNVLKWNTPFEGFNANVFQITREGRSVLYLGRVVKRGKPQPGDYLAIGANASISIEVNLAQAYGIYEAGEYSIQYNTTILDYGQEASTQLSAKQVFEPKRIQSNTALLKLSENRPQPQGKEAPIKDFSRKAANFENCSQSQQDILNTALQNAQDYAATSLLVLLGTSESKRSNAERYTTWFGTYDATRYNTVANHFQEINDALKYQTITFHCDCDENYYAYVYPSSPYHVYLCKLFWTAPDKGTDSQAGTINHEVSHFNVVASTDDHAYGQSSCKNLAQNDPDKAIDNADSHEYFAENNPPLSMGLDLMVYSLILIFLTVFVYLTILFRKRMLTL